MYNVNTMKKEKKISYTIRIRSEQLEYLRKISNLNYTTVTQYILDLINNDMKSKEK